ncbi:hypothetical protein OHT76_29065 [Streptomyces sp. NBC_00287]|uniref:hypothetical protein n=1 Tax=Streptomyces sp. NBC_00287 TaxID=2975702 RepID=UPI002E2B9B4F|nr:hypothetical protein [Streptomyces sp. NBC_00287]
MDVFVCAGCDAALTVPVARVALPVHAHHSSWHELLPPLMEPGTYAVDPGPSGVPWRRYDEVGEAGAAARGVYAPVYLLSFGAPGRIVLAPGDSRGLVLIPECCEGYCLGLDGGGGPNLACERCGRAVATRLDDCSLWQAVWLEPDAVRRLSTGGPAPEPSAPATPPIDPAGGWDRRWTAAVGAAPAHLVVASEGEPVAFPDGLLAELFGRAAAVIFPPGPAPKSVGLAGPGRTCDADIALVPRHPRTGEPWQPPAPVPTVPLATDVWAYLADPEEISPFPASGTLPDGVLRDDYPLPPHPGYAFHPDRQVFMHTLARLPAVRRPRVREIYDRLWAGPNPVLW